MLEEAVRRNRRRALAAVALAILNAWALVSLLAFTALWLVVPGPHVAVVAPAAAAVGLLGALVLLSPVLWVRDRTLDQLGAVTLRPGELARVDGLVSGLAIAVGTPPVALALLADDAPNALTVGLRPSRTTLVVTTGLVERLTRDELDPQPRGHAVRAQEAAG
ncbi:MAG TPA: hypothetical protein VH479_21635 [Acidimicrobiales bacterium]